MTYRELMNQLLTLNETQLDDTVTVFDTCEQMYKAIGDTDKITNPSLETPYHKDVLNNGHMFLKSSENESDYDYRRAMLLANLL
jgi:hypothetical protein